MKSDNYMSHLTAISSTRKLKVICLFATIISLCSIACEKEPRDLKVDIDWPAFMADHDLIWDVLPGRWENAPFNGNGLIGSMLHASGDDTLKIILCRSDIGKLDFPGKFRTGNRLQLGSIDLKTKGKILYDQSHLRLNLWDAEISGQIKTTKGSFKLRSFVALNEPALIVETFDFEGDERGEGWQPKFNNKGTQTTENGINIFEVADRKFHMRSEVKSGGHVIAWKEGTGNGRNELVISINSSPSTHSIWNTTDRGKLSAREDAQLTISNLNGTDSGTLFKKQAEWWHDYYQRSFVSFTHQDLESYYWIQLYKMASSSRSGYPMIDNHGVWSTEETYGFATWDLNVQAIYRLHLASNHLELGEPLLRFLDKNFNRESMFIDSLGEMRAGLKQQTFLRYRFFDPVNWEHKTPGDGPAKFLWGCHNYWLHYQYSQDSAHLPKLRDMLEGGINAMRSGMKLEGDGKWHVPHGSNWENWKGKDPNSHLGVLNWALETIIPLEKDKKKQEEWIDFQNNIADYVVGENGYMLGWQKEVVAHRHWSHILHLFPLRTTKWEENPRLYEKSVDTWTNLSTGIQDGVPLAGYSPCSAICLYAQMGKTEPMDKLLNIFLYQKSSRGPNVWANTMYREYGPVIETPLFFAATLQELFLQSHESVVKVFPAVPELLGDIAFHDYRTEGGFLISAKRKNGKTCFVRIQSLHGNPLKLKADIQNMTISGHPDMVQRVENDEYRVILEKGESVLVYDGDYRNELSVEKVKNKTGQPNPFGLNSRFYEKRPYHKDLQFTGR
jgi:alpha-L-fucosidase 2